MIRKRKVQFPLLFVIAILLTAFWGSPVQAAVDSQEEQISPYCTGDIEENHPVAEAIAASYQISYQQVMNWFCGGSGAEYSGADLGQIMLALQSAEESQEGNQTKEKVQKAQQILTWRASGQGWGKIWQEAGLIGKAKVKGKGNPDHAGPPAEADIPDHAGPPDQIGKPEGVGPE